MSTNVTTPVTLIGGNCDPNEKLWWVFFCSSIITLAGGLLLVFFGRVVSIINKKLSKRRSASCKRVEDDNRRVEKIKTGDKQGDIGCVTAAKDWAGELISGQTNSGRILVREIWLGRGWEVTDSPLSPWCRDWAKQVERERERDPVGQAVCSLVTVVITGNVMACLIFYW